MYQYFADFEQFEKRSSYFSDFERVGHDCFLDILLNPSYPCLSVKIFSFLFIRYGCSCILKRDFNNRPARVNNNNHNHNNMVNHNSHNNNKKRL